MHPTHKNHTFLDPNDMTKTETNFSWSSETRLMGAVAGPAHRSGRWCAMNPGVRRSTESRRVCLLGCYSCFCSKNRGLRFLKGKWMILWLKQPFIFFFKLSFGLLVPCSFPVVFGCLQEMQHALHESLGTAATTKTLGTALNVQAMDGWWVECLRFVFYFSIYSEGEVVKRILAVVCGCVLFWGHFVWFQCCLLCGIVHWFMFFLGVVVLSFCGEFTFDFMGLSRYFLCLQSSRFCVFWHFYYK